MSIFWSIYKNLEKELIALSDSIYFCDTQNSVYSVHISDLLIRTAVEIEALSKELYKVAGGNMNPVDQNGKSRDLYFDSDCIQHLDKNWGITKKTVNVVCPNFFFEKGENLSFMPLRNCNKVGDGRWKKAYQAVKHNRIEALPAGNIANLIRAMAALYLLNIYYRNDRFEVGTSANSEPFDCRMGSDVFSVLLAHAEKCKFSRSMGDDSIDESVKAELSSSVLIKRYTEDSFKLLHSSMLEFDEEAIKMLLGSNEVRTFLSLNPGYKADNYISLAQNAGGEALMSRMLRGQSLIKNISKANMEVIVYKGGNIYPELNGQKAQSTEG